MVSAISVSRAPTGPYATSWSPVERVSHPTLTNERQINKFRVKPRLCNWSTFTHFLAEKHCKRKSKAELSLSWFSFLGPFLLTQQLIIIASSYLIIII